MITVSQIETLLGKMTACSVAEGICMLSFGDKAFNAGELKFLAKYFNYSVIEGENEHLRILRQQVEEYFKGTRKEFTLKLAAPGTIFQKSVWNELLTIKYGCTRSYMEQSAALGVPGSVRAVANANGKNRIAIVIPCHRIIGSDGSLTGYAGGLDKKKWLLTHEEKYSGKSFSPTLF